jgi:hypothetical protein
VLWSQVPDLTVQISVFGSAVGVETCKVIAFIDAFVVIVLKVLEIHFIRVSNEIIIEGSAYQHVILDL